MRRHASPVFEVKVECQQGSDESGRSDDLDDPDDSGDPDGTSGLYGPDAASASGKSGESSASHASKGSSDDEPPPTRRLHYARVMLPGGGTALRGGLAFTTGAQGGFTHRDLLSWFDEHLAAPRWMKRPQAFHEPGEPSLTGTSNAGALAITKAARERVLAAITGLVAQDAANAQNADPRFLSAAIDAARVRRVVVAGRSRWVPSPRETDALSDIVLSLFIADILLDPDFYRAHLCVCRRCGGLSIEPRESAVQGVCTPCSGGLMSLRGA